jgi:hypothetical protein
MRLVQVTVVNLNNQIMPFENLSLDTMLQKSYNWVKNVAIDFINRRMEIDRLSQLGYVLLRANEILPKQYPYQREIINNIFLQILQKQNDDGGWKDVEETMWALATLKYHKEQTKCLNHGYEWLKKQKNSSGGWGRNNRDFSRIPVTCRIAILHNCICHADDFAWILSDLQHEVLDRKNTFFLSYKAALPLVAFKKNNLEITNKNQLYDLLSKEQNDDGGYAPWKNHPIGSEIVSSACALMAFSQEKGYEKEINGIINWMHKMQLPNGSWPYHFIDYGTSLGLWALLEIKRGF